MRKLPEFARLVDPYDILEHPEAAETALANVARVQLDEYRTMPLPPGQVTKLLLRIFDINTPLGELASMIVQANIAMGQRRWSPKILDTSFVTEKISRKPRRRRLR